MGPQAPVAQLDRASDYGSEGREFDSLRAHQAMSRVVNTSDPELTPLLQGYAGYRQRLQAVCPQLTDDVLMAPLMQRLDSLEEVYQDAQAILFDSYGVLNLGQRPLPGMPKTVAKLRKLGKQVRVLTNNASLSGAGIAKFLNNLGYNFDESEIISCGHALKTYVRRHNLEGSAMYCIGPPASRQYIWEAGGLPCNQAVAAGRGHEAQWVVLASSGEFDSAQYQTAKALMAQGKNTICLNADLVAPLSETQLSETIGAVALQLEKETGRPVTMLGKPFTWIYDTVLGPLITVPNRSILMIGDSLYTDVLGGLAAGICCVLTPSAIPFLGAEKGIPDFCRGAGILPHYYVERLDALCI